MYLTLVIYAAKKYEQRIQLTWVYDLFLPIVTILIIVLSGFYFSKTF